MPATALAPRSKLPYVVLATIAVAIAFALWRSGLGAEMLGYKKDIVYLTKQHLVLVAVSGSAAIVVGVAIGVWLSPAAGSWARSSVREQAARPRGAISRGATSRIGTRRRELGTR